MLVYLACIVCFFEYTGTCLLSGEELMFESVKKYNFWNKEEIKFGFQRDFYIKNISKYTGNSLIKVLLGQRRSGKSYILRMLINSLTEQGIKRKNTTIP